MIRAFSYFIALSLTSIGLLLLICKSPMALSMLPPKQQIYLQWFVSHYSDNLLNRNPKALNKIKKTSLSYLGDSKEQFITAIPFFLNNTQKNGQYDLDINIINWEHKKKHGVIIEYHLNNSSNNNKIWEYGQTFGIH